MGARKAGAVKSGRKSGPTSDLASSTCSPTGEATWDEGLLLFLERSGFPEETYHTFSYSPLHDDDGEVGGHVLRRHRGDTRVIGERRLGLLREFGTQLAASQTTDDVWAAVERSMATERGTCRSR